MYGLNQEKYNELKQQLLLHIDEILSIIIKGDTAEIKKNKDGVSVFDVSRKKIKKGLD